jgi:hypothetical protein
MCSEKLGDWEKATIIIIIIIEFNETKSIIIRDM